MSKWKVAAIGEIAELDREVVEPRHILAGTTYVGLENIERGGSFSRVGQVHNGDLKSSKFIFSSEHILFGKLRPYLAKVALPDFEGICSTDIIPIKPGPSVDRRFLAHFLRLPSQVALATSRSVGINLPRLSPKALAEFEVPLPPLPDQRRIAAILDQADALRAKRRAALALLDEMAQATFAEMFGDPESNPMCWPRQDLGSILKYGPQNGLYKHASAYGSGTPILRIDSFYNGSVTNITDLKRVSLSQAEKELYCLNENDIVVNRVNSREFLGKSAIIPRLAETTVFESNMMRLRVDSKIVNPIFVVAYLQTPYVRSQIKRAAKDAVNQSSINQTDVRSFQINIPPLKLQKAYATRLAALEELKRLHRQAGSQLNDLFASLQHRAFRGDL